MNIKSTANSPPARDTSGDWEFRPHSANVTGGTNAVAELPSTRGIYFMLLLLISYDFLSASYCHCHHDCHF